MKNIFYFFFILTILACSEKESSDGNRLDNKTTEVQVNSKPTIKKMQSVSDIRASYAEINERIRTKSLDSSFFKYNCNDEKSGIVTFFKEKGKVRLIRHSHSEYSHFSATNEYFVESDSVFFIYSKEVQWTFADQNKTRDEIVEKRFYVLNDQPVKCLQNESTVLVSSAESNVLKATSNKKINCSSFRPMLMQFKKLISLQDQKKDMQCLE